MYLWKVETTPKMHRVSCCKGKPAYVLKKPCTSSAVFWGVSRNWAEIILRVSHADWHLCPPIRERASLATPRRLVKGRWKQKVELISGLSHEAGFIRYLDWSLIRFYIFYFKKTDDYRHGNPCAPKIFLDGFQTIYICVDKIPLKNPVMLFLVNNFHCPFSLTTMCSCACIGKVWRLYGVKSLSEIKGQHMTNHSEASETTHTRTCPKSLGQGSPRFFMAGQMGHYAPINQRV